MVDHLDLRLVADDGPQLADQVGGPKAGQQAAVDAEGDLAGDDVHLATRLEHGRADGVAEQGGEEAAAVAEQLEDAVGQPRVEQLGDQPAGQAADGRGDGAKHHAGRRRDMDRQGAGVELLQAAAEFGHRAAPHGHRAVAAGTVKGDLEPADLLFGDLDRVEPAPADGEGEPAELAEGVANAGELVGMGFDEEPGPELAAGFFVRDDGEQNVARQPEVLGLGAQEGGDHHGDAALHVERSAAPDSVVDEAAFERRVLPALVLGGDDVHVTVEHQGGGVPLSGQAGNQVGAVGRFGEDLGLDPGLGEEPVDEGDAFGLVARWVGGIEPDQLLQELDGVGHGRGWVLLWVHWPPP